MTPPTASLYSAQSAAARGLALCHTCGKLSAITSSACPTAGQHSAHLGTLADGKNPKNLKNPKNPCKRFPPVSTPAWPS